MCGYDGTGYTGAMLPFAKYMCGYYHNLGEQGFNDRLSSLDNWAAYTQYFWKDADQKGAELSLAPYGMYSNLSNQGFNNLISSVLWTG
jgi:hypothetical protein